MEDTVKKLWLVVAVVALGGLTGRSFADTQSILLSGDVRVRGYFLDRAGNDGAGAQSQGNASFISQRTRVSLAADLDSHLLVVVTLKAEGLWGGDDLSGADSGAGTANSKVIDRAFALGVNEAYLQMNQAFDAPATVKIGRQFLNYGHGLILSSAEQEYNFDAARLVLDYYPWTFDLVAASLVNGQAFSSTPSHLGAADLLFVNARYEMTDSILKNIEGYFGWVAQSHSQSFSLRVPPTDPLFAANASPWVIGLRGDLAPGKNAQMWFEAAYEGGADGALAPFSKAISAFLINLGGRFTLKDEQWSPSFNINYIYASGGGDSESGNFRPWFNYQDGYNGYLFAPTLSNIQIFNLGATVKPQENLSLALQVYYYVHIDKNSPYGDFSELNIDMGGLGTAADIGRSDGSWELDAIAGYDYSKDLRLQLVYAAFIPGHGFRQAGMSAVAQELRGELNVKF
jgi:hypothetical protein